MNVLNVMQRWPRLTAHVIAESLGYATPSKAAIIVLAAHQGKPHYCEWIAACYEDDPIPAVQAAIRNRHNHTGFMAEYKVAKALVDKALATGQEPSLASWF